MTVSTADLKIMAAIAEEDGHAAYGEDRPAAPWLSTVVQKLVKDMEVGDGAAEVFEAFSAGYRQAADEECARILAED